MEDKEAQLQEAVKMGGGRNTRDRTTSCKGVKFALVMR